MPSGFKAVDAVRAVPCLELGMHNFLCFFQSVFWHSLTAVVGTFATTAFHESDRDLVAVAGRQQFPVRQDSDLVAFSTWIGSMSCSLEPRPVVRTPTKDLFQSRLLSKSLLMAFQEQNARGEAGRLRTATHKEHR